MPSARYHWKLLVLGLVLIALFISLGCWQLSRAKQKQILLDLYAQRLTEAPLQASALAHIPNPRFYQLTIRGYFDNAHSLLLDNKTWHGQVGYEVYTPFYSKTLPAALLVDRGFVPLGSSRSLLPSIKNREGTVTITGMLNLPPTYVALGQMLESQTLSFPLRIEFIELQQLAQHLHTPLYPYVLSLKADDPAAFSIEWQIALIKPEKHLGYALQWFAFALTLLILCVLLHYKR
jgi:surfeit locus 1 family protein